MTPTLEKITTTLHVTTSLACCACMRPLTPSQVKYNTNEGPVCSDRCYGEIADIEERWGTVEYQPPKP